jgi:L-alanine-DL-glutamate epimerase-like enolase superfamily enzyme
MNPRAPRRVKANASLGALDGAELSPARLDAKVLKVKLGVLAPNPELQRLAALAAVLPKGAQLRLDANGAWGWSTARRFIEALEGLPIESLEEPLAEPTPRLLERLQELASFPLGMDESLPAWLTARGRRGTLRAAPVRRLVCKPMVLGGPLRVLKLAREAADQGVECVVTTSLDSAVGCWAAAHTAAALNNGLAHGLGTSAWLRRDVGLGPRVRNGYVGLQGVQGLLPCGRRYATG